MSENQNPYAPPSQEAELGSEEASDQSPLRNARQGARFVNSLVDGVCAAVISFATGQVFGDVVGGWLGLLTTIAYWPLFEGLFGKTPAKWLTRTRVVASDGGRPSPKQILIRSLVRYIPFEFVSFFGSRRPIGWHDRWSETRVVEDER